MNGPSLLIIEFETHGFRKSGHRRPRFSARLLLPPEPEVIVKPVKKGTIGTLVDGIVYAEKNDLSETVGKRVAHRDASSANLDSSMGTIVDKLQRPLQKAPEESQPVVLDSEEFQDGENGSVRQRRSEPFEVGPDDGEFSAKGGMDQRLRDQKMEQ